MHYRFTDKMTFRIDDENKTIQIIGSYGYDDFGEDEYKLLAKYEGYTLLPCDEHRAIN